MLAKRWTLLVVFSTMLLVVACGSPDTEDPQPEAATATPTVVQQVPPTATAPAGAGADQEEPTPTPTPTAGAASVPESSVCADLSGSLEVQIRVGPAEAVGLEPAAVGSVPFTVTPDQGTYVVQGQNTLTYEDVLQRDWGTYSVSLDMTVSIEGTCVDEAGGAVLDLTLVNTGEQMVEVSAGGFQREYPWSGEHTFNLSFPVQEGASAGGEGWLFVLHLN